MMKLDERIKHEKLQEDVNRKAAKISALPSHKIEKYDK